MIRASLRDGVTFFGVGDVSISDSSFVQNGGYGLNNQSSQQVITATLNYWGAASGPYQATLNPSGQGEEVTSGVLFDPWSASYLLPGNGRLSSAHLESNNNPAQSAGYGYDAIGRLTQLRSSGFTTYTLSYNYDAAGRLLTRNPVQGALLASAYGYDNANRLTSLSYDAGGGALLSETYSYNAMGNLVGLVSSRDGSSTYTYDSLDRLSGVNGPGINASYTYDAAGNRTKAGNITYIYDSGGRLVSASNGTTYSYDAAGNLITRTQGGQTTTLTWDAQGRLARIDFPDGSHSAYQYDDFGRRIHKRLPDGSNIYYLYDGSLLMQELNGSGAVIASFTYDGLDRPVSMWRGGKTYFYLLDRLGSVVGLIDDNGSTVATYRYDPWGNLLSSTGALSNPLRFIAREYDAESGLYFFRARYYDPQAGRFINRDPAGITGGLNLYAYVADNPVNLVDPFGFQSAGGGQPYGSQFAQDVGNKVVKEMGEKVIKKQLKLDTYKPKDMKEQERLQKMAAERCNDSVNPFGGVQKSLWQRAIDALFGGGDSDNSSPPPQQQPPQPAPRQLNTFPGS